jgi:phosphopantetheine adenylyltransferase
LEDPFGPPIIDPTFDCIIVSDETIKGGEKINQIRKEKGMSELVISCIPLVQSESSR